MSNECTPKAKRGLELALTPAGDARKASAQQLDRQAGTPLTHEEMRMALRVLEMVEQGVTILYRTEVTVL